MELISEAKVYHGNPNKPLLELLPFSGSGRRVLDCGCGGGDNAKVLKARGFEVIGITISREEQSLAEEFCERVYVANLEDGLPAEVKELMFDIVVMSHVLEHLIHSQRLLDDARRVLLRNGILAVALPNVLVYYNRLKMLCGRFEYETYGVMDETHVRFYTPSSGSRLLQLSGYKVIVHSASGGVPLRWLRRILPLRVSKWIDHQGASRRPTLFAEQALYLATPEPRSLGH